MGGAGSLGRHGQQLLVAQTFFTAQCAQLFLAAQFLGHFRGKERDYRSRQGKAQPHAVDLQFFPRDRQRLQWIELHQHQGVQRQRHAGEHHRITPGQGHRSNRQWYQVIGHEGIGRTAREIQQRTVDKQVAGQLHGIFEFGDRPGGAQTHQGEGAEHRRTDQRGPQLQPGQRQ